MNEKCPRCSRVGEGSTYPALALRWAIKPAMLFKVAAHASKGRWSRSPTTKFRGPGRESRKRLQLDLGRLLNSDGSYKLTPGF